MTPSPVSTVVPLPFMMPPDHVKGPEIVVAPLPPSVAPPRESAAAKVAAWFALKVAPLPRRMRPSPSKRVAAPVVSTPESMTSVPAPVRPKVPDMRLPALLSARSVRTVPSAMLRVDPSSALKRAVPPVPADM